MAKMLLAKSKTLKHMKAGGLLIFSVLALSICQTGQQTQALNPEFVDIAKIGWGKLYVAYQRFNEYLVDHVEQTDVKTNLDFANNLLKTKLDGGASLEDPYILALKLFTFLSKVYDGTVKCNRDSADILQYNSNVAHGEVRRVDIITTEVSIKHALECENTYFETFKRKYESMDRSKLAPIEYIFDLKNIASRRPVAADNLYTAIRDNSLQIRPNSVLSRLNFCAKNDPDHTYLTLRDYRTFRIEFHEEKFSKLFERYIAEPCKYLMDELGREVFRPARYDSHFIHRVNKALPEFYYTWARNILCRRYVVSEDSNLPLGSEYYRLRAYISDESMLSFLNLNTLY